MAPFAVSGNRIKDRLATLRSLYLDRYFVDVNHVIDRMAKRQSQTEWSTCSYTRPDATLAEVRGAVIESQCRIYDQCRDINEKAKTVTNEAANLADIAICTKWRLIYDALSTGIFVGIGALCVFHKKKLAALVSLLSALVTTYSFFDELDIRSDELNFEFDYLRELCAHLAEDILDFAIIRENHNFFAAVLKKRFGEVFVDGTDDPDELLETYVPDASFDCD